MSNMFRLVDTGYVLNMRNMDYRQLVAERHQKLVSKFADMKNMDYMDPFNLRGVF